MREKKGGKKNFNPINEFRKKCHENLPYRRASMSENLYLLVINGH